MADRVDPDKIELIVGRKRGVRAHYGKVVTEERMVYILHSQTCFDNDDLMICKYTQALERGLRADDWIGWENTPVRLKVNDTNFLVPARHAKKYKNNIDCHRETVDGKCTNLRHYHVKGKLTHFICFGCECAVPIEDMFKATENLRITGYCNKCADS